MTEFYGEETKQGLVVATDDIRPTYEELTAKGVSFDFFDFPPTEMPGEHRRCFATPIATGSCSGSVSSAHAEEMCARVQQEPPKND